MSAFAKASANRALAAEKAAAEKADTADHAGGFAFTRCPDCDTPGQVVSAVENREKGIRRRTIRCVNDDCAMQTWRQVTVS